MKEDLQLVIMTATVAMEAAGEPDEGKLAVAYVIRNRAEEAGKSLTDICLMPYQFSCWNTDSPTRMNLDTISETTLAECQVAALMAVFEMAPDPTGGAVFYLNPDTVIQVSGGLPSWWQIDGDPASEVKIGAHLFRAKKGKSEPQQV